VIEESIHVGALQEELRAQFKVFGDQLVTLIDGQRKADECLARLETKVDRIEIRLDVLEAKVDKLENRFDALEAKVDKLENRFDVLETKVDASASDTQARLKRIETHLEFRAERSRSKAKAHGSPKRTRSGR
jgi:predicted nuclease with TOPRIM domain